MAELYQTIAQLCADKGINITELCRQSGASRGSLSDLKKGRKQSLSADTLSKIAAYFGVSVDYLLGNTEEKEKPASQEADELIKSDPLAGQLFAAYGRVKEEFSQAEIDDITMIMEMLAEKKRRKREKGEE
jgi:hypothetical protein